jgi:lactoylglutathione lyase
MANTLAELRKLDIPLSGQTMKHPTGISCFIRDPDKNVIEFIEYIGLNAFK